MRRSRQNPERKLIKFTQEEVRKVANANGESHCDNCGQWVDPAHALTPHGHRPCESTTDESREIQKRVFDGLHDVMLGRREGYNPQDALRDPT